MHTLLESVIFVKYMISKAKTASYYIDIELFNSLNEYVKIQQEARFPERVNRSEIICKFIKEGLDRNYPNWKYKQILKNSNENS